MKTRSARSRFSFVAPAAVLTLVLLAGLRPAAAAGPGGGGGGPIERPQLSSITVSPSAVPGGESATGRVRLTLPALAGGTGVSLSSSHPAVAAVPSGILVPEGADEATFTVQTAAVNSSPSVLPLGVSVSIGAACGLSSGSARLRVLPPLVETIFAAGPVYGGQQSLASVKLTGPAPAGGAVVSIAAGNAAVATAPGRITVPPGERFGMFVITTFPVGTTTSVGFSAQRGPFDIKTCSLQVRAARLAGVALTPTATRGGVNVQGRVYLTSPAGAPLWINLASSDAFARPDVSLIRIDPGKASALFNITTRGVKRDTPVAIAAAYNGDSHSKILTLQGPKVSSVSVPPQAGEGSYTGTVHLTFSASPGQSESLASVSSSSPYDVRIISVGSFSGSSANFGIKIAARPYEVTAKIRAFYNGSSAEATIFVPRAYKSDLKIHGVSFTDWYGSALTAPTPGRAWRAHITAANSGNAASPQTRLKVTVLNGAGAAAAAGYVTLPPLAAGTGVTLTYSQPILPAGEYRLVIEVDPDNTAAEFNDSNNVWTLDF